MLRRAAVALPTTPSMLRGVTAHRIASHRSSQPSPWRFADRQRRQQLQQQVMLPSQPHTTRMWPTRLNTAAEASPTALQRRERRPDQSLPICSAAGGPLRRPCDHSRRRPPGPVNCPGLVDQLTERAVFCRRTRRAALFSDITHETLLLSEAPSAELASRSIPHIPELQTPD